MFITRSAAAALATGALLCWTESSRSAAMPAPSTQKGAQENRSRHFGPGNCGPVDPTYLHMANETGGQPFFLSPFEIADSAHIMRETSGRDAELLVWSSAALPNDTREIPIPVDSTVRRLTVVASFDSKGGELTLAAPNGSGIMRGDGVEDSRFNCGRIVTVATPASGTWRATVNPSSRYWLTARARTDLALSGADFVAPGGRPGHEGLFRIAGQPIAGAPATLRAHVSHELVRSTSFALVSERGDVLQRVDLNPTGDGEFIGSIELPQTPFRVAATGLDVAGAPYQRVHAGLFHAELVEISPVLGTDTVQAGSTSTVRFTVRNVGATANFRIIAADGRQFVRSVQPQVLSLDSGQAGNVIVSITVPADVAAGTGVDVTVTASGDAPRKTTNSVTRHLTVGAPQLQER